MKTIDLSTNEGVFLGFVNKKRLTGYKLKGKMEATINEGTVLLHFESDADAELLGFANAPEFNSDPFIGGFEDEKPETEDNDNGGQGGYRLSILPCIDQLSDIYLLDERFTKKGADTVEFQLMTHSLIYNEEYIKKGLFSKCDYSIVGADGRVYVSVVQKQGAKCLQLGGQCGNNHPRFEDNVPGLGKHDCKVFLPKQDYWVEMKNTGDVPINTLVHHPHTNDGENRDIFNQWTGSGQKVSVHISAEKEFNGEDYRNAIKINGNA